jgi:glycogen operon protein
MVPSFASRICGSADVYSGSGKGPECSINFVACHDGFTLNDVVSYKRKHNDANGEDNRDGADENHSANHGVEGETDDPATESVRRRQIKNFLLTLAISRGVPMLLGGDEFRRTQGGNNNAYCQDNGTSWIDWSFRQRHDEIVRFTRHALAFRRANAVLRQEAFYLDRDIHWFDPAGQVPKWRDPRQKRLACLIRGVAGPDLYLMFNADVDPIPFVLPPRAEPWLVAVDTAQPSPQDICAIGDERDLEDQGRYVVESRSCAVLVASR